VKAGSTGANVGFPPSCWTAAKPGLAPVPHLQVPLALMSGSHASIALDEQRADCRPMAASQDLDGAARRDRTVASFK